MAAGQGTCLDRGGFAQRQAIGWLPTNGHYADQKEQSKNNWPDNTLVIEEWLPIEYAAGTLPVNPETAVDIVSKAAPMPEALCKALGWDVAIFKLRQDGTGDEGGARRLPERIRFTPIGEIANAVERAIAKIDLGRITQEIVDRKRGRV